MNNQLIEEKGWWKKNWKWSLPTSIILLFIFFGLIISLSIEGNVTDFAQAYSDNSLYENAIEKVKTNNRVLEVIGEIEPIDKLAILEGNVLYTNNNNSVELSVRVKGSKGKGKMDISADKNGDAWEYKIIKVRIKDSKEEINILKE